MEKKRENRKGAEEDLKRERKRKKKILSYVKAGRGVLVNMYTTVLICEV